MTDSRGRKKNNRNKINYIKYNDVEEEVKKKDEGNGNNNSNIPVRRQILNAGKII